MQAQRHDRAAGSSFFTKECDGQKYEAVGFCGKDTRNERAAIEKRICFAGARDISWQASRAHETGLAPNDSNLNEYIKTGPQRKQLASFEGWFFYSVINPASLVLVHSFHIR